MDASLALAIGGAAGSAVKAIAANDQITLSKKSVVDVLIGAAVGVLLPLFPVIPLPKDASLVQQAVLVGIVAYTSGDLLVNLLQKIGVGAPAQPKQ